VANAWNASAPSGYTILNGRAELTDFLAVIFQPFAPPRDRAANARRRLHHGRLLRPGHLGMAPAAAPQSHREFFRKSFALRPPGTLAFPCSKWRRGT
jgi:hypothetical protein